MAARHRLALAVVGILVLVLLALLPVAVTSVVVNIVGLPYSEVYRLLDAERPAAGEHSRLHAEVVAMDPWQQLITIRVSGHRVCEPGCDWQGQVVFFSLHADSPEAEGLPPSASVTLPSTAAPVTTTVQLPVSGQPIRFPFDVADLWLGVALQRVNPDGTVQNLTPGEAEGRLLLTIRNRLPLYAMQPRVLIEPQSVWSAHAPADYLSVSQFTLHRPLWLPLLTVMLVLLIAAAAAYALFMQRLHDLVIGAGGLVLGVWGIRAVMLPAGITWMTAVDLSLAAVLLFLLGGLTVRTLLALCERNGLRLTRRRRADGTAPGPGPAPRAHDARALQAADVGRWEPRGRRAHGPREATPDGLSSRGRSRFRRRRPSGAPAVTVPSPAVRGDAQPGDHSRHSA